MLRLVGAFAGALWFFLCVCLSLARRHVGLLDCDVYEVIVCVFRTEIAYVPVLQVD